MKWLSARLFGLWGWRVAVPAAVAVVLLAVTVAFAAYFASQAMDGTGVAQETDEPTAATPAGPPSPTPAATPEPSPEPAVLPTTAPSTRGALGCVDCRVKARDQLKVTAEDLRLGKDGKYYVPDRGDGCAYEQDTSSSWGLVLRAPGCEMFWVQVSEPGELRPVIP
jgi:hypothetical protein